MDETVTEPNERIASLETNMNYVLGVLAKREEYQNSVLKSLTTIELKQDQAITYQNTCNAERSAHAGRIGDVENAITGIAKALKILDDHDNRLTTLETSLSRGETVWWTLFKVVGCLGGVTTVMGVVVGIVVALTGMGHH